jgi:hypothetical protein
VVKIDTSGYADTQGTVLEPDIYEAVLTGFGETEGNFGPRLVWQFEIQHEGEAVEAAGFTSYSMADGEKKSNLVLWARAINGGELPEDTDDLIGMACRVDVDNYTKTNGVTKNKVTSVRPAKGAKPKAKTNGAGGKTAKKSDVELTEEEFGDIPFKVYNTKGLAVRDIL